MNIIIKPSNGQFIGYIRVGKINIYSVITESVDKTLDGINQWLIVAKTKNIIFC